MKLDEAKEILESEGFELNENSDLKAKNSADRAKLKKKLEIFASSVTEFPVLEPIFIAGAGDNINGLMRFDLGNNVAIFIRKFINGRTICDIRTVRYGDLPSEKVIYCMKNADKIFSFMDKCKKLKV
jgi:hypothetical protein